MTELLLLLPRLHRELARTPDVPPGARTLWPGLPQAPADAFVPDYPWTPAQARACLADFEQTCRAGAGGAPVLAFSVADMLGAGGDLSPAERRALDELVGRQPAAPPAGEDAGEVARRLASQRALLLAWLQEQQVLELRALEQRVREGRFALAGLLGEGGEADASAAPYADDAPLPAWRAVLAAAAPFLPAGTAVLATDPDMAEAVLAAAGPESALPDHDVPAGFAGARLSLGELLGKGWNLPETSRVLPFLYPFPQAGERPERA